MMNLTALVMDLDSPRNWSNLGTMVCWHRRYSIGDKHNYDNPQEFFRGIASDSLTAKELIAYVRAGEADGVKLVYDKSTREWELKSYYNYSKKWYTEYTAKAPLDMDDEYLAEVILRELTTANLKELAEKKNCILPLYLYEHSIQSISVGSFIGRAHHAEWDSRLVGYIYASYADIEQRYGAVTNDTIKCAVNTMTTEVDDYDYYMQGSDI